MEIKNTFQEKLGALGSSEVASRSPRHDGSPRNKKCKREQKKKAQENVGE